MKSYLVILHIVVPCLAECPAFKFINLLLKLYFWSGSCFILSAIPVVEILCMYLFRFFNAVLFPDQAVRLGMRLLLFPLRFSTRLRKVFLGVVVQWFNAIHPKPDQLGTDFSFKTMPSAIRIFLPSNPTSY